MWVTSRTTIPCTTRRVTNASRWPEGIWEVHTTATGGGAAGPPGVGLGNASRGGLGCWLAAADGDDFAVLGGVLPHATASSSRTSRNLFTPPAILRLTAPLTNPGVRRKSTQPVR